MKRLILTIIIIVLVLPLKSFCDDISQEMHQETEKAMKDGKALYEAYIKGPIAIKDAEKEKNKINDFCEFQYKAYAVNGNIYFIAEPTANEGIMFGRHYKVTETDLIKSTSSCFVTPPPPSNSVAAYTTHLLTDTPTEFHVFLSLKHKNPIYVGTKTGTWKVEQGGIDFVEKRK
jgi:hypothetical protein